MKTKEKAHVDTEEKVIMWIVIVYVVSMLTLLVWGLVTEAHRKVPINERDTTRIIFHRNIEVDTIYVKGKIIKL